MRFEGFAQNVYCLKVLPSLERDIVLVLLLRGWWMLNKSEKVST